MGNAEVVRLYLIALDWESIIQPSLASLSTYFTIDVSLEALKQSSVAAPKPDTLH